MGQNASSAGSKAVRQAPDAVRAAAAVKFPPPHVLANSRPHPPAERMTCSSFYLQK